MWDGRVEFIRPRLRVCIWIGLAACVLDPGASAVSIAWAQSPNLTRVHPTVKLPTDAEPGIGRTV